MKLSLPFNVISALILISFQTQQAEAVPTNKQSFEQWCLQKNSLPVETRKTVELLLNKASTQRCKLADLRLNKLSELFLTDNQITDITPISSLVNLTYLDLKDNQISDLKPLESLANLSVISIEGNQISDVKPLAVLTKLTQVNLGQNRISKKVCPVQPESICSF